jgi:novobiocin biosynthesis protein NovU/D-mycarose 3-C-methyltransferase
MIRERSNCRTCGSKNLALVLDLGSTALANDFIPADQVSKYKTSLPLRLCVCRDCSLAQLADTVSPDVLYSRYAYVTSTSRTMEEHLTGQLAHLMKVGAFKRPPRVVEIASNTGIYLKKFKQLGCDVLGLEPAENIAQLAIRDGVPTRVEFFNDASAEVIRREWGQADLILGRHVFAHIDDLADLVKGLEALSHPQTIIAFEVPYLVDFFKGVQFDTIYHEHLSYISVRSIQALVEKSPFFLQRIDYYPIHGGCILFQLRLRAAGGEVDESVAKATAIEKSMELGDPASWKPFVDQVRHIQSALPSLLRSLRSQGKSIIGYGASAKGNTLLNTCGITAKDLDFIIDNTPFKQNKVAPGSWIPIRPPERLQDRPDYALILAWNFAPEIIQRERAYQTAGGRFILPLPQPQIVQDSE